MIATEIQYSFTSTNLIFRRTSLKNFIFSFDNFPLNYLYVLCYNVSNKSENGICELLISTKAGKGLAWFINSSYICAIFL